MHRKQRITMFCSVMWAEKSPETQFVHIHIANMDEHHSEFFHCAYPDSEIVERLNAVDINWDLVIDAVAKHGKLFDNANLVFHSKRSFRNRTRRLFNEFMLHFSRAWRPNIQDPHDNTEVHEGMRVVQLLQGFRCTCLFNGGKFLSRYRQEKGAMRPTSSTKVHVPRCCCEASADRPSVRRCGGGSWASKLFPPARFLTKNQRVGDLQVQ